MYISSWNENFKINKWEYKSKDKIQKKKKNHLNMGGALIVEKKKKKSLKYVGGSYCWKKKITRSTIISNKIE